MPPRALMSPTRRQLVAALCVLFAGGLRRRGGRRIGRSQRPELALIETSNLCEQSGRDRQPLHCQEVERTESAHKIGRLHLGRLSIDGLSGNFVYALGIYLHILQVDCEVLEVLQEPGKLPIIWPIVSRMWKELREAPVLHN